MLTDKERDKLLGRIADVKQRKNLNYRVKNKLCLIDPTLADIRLMIENISEKEVKESTSLETVYTLMAILEKFLKMVDPWPVAEHINGGLRAFRVMGNYMPKNPTIEPGKCGLDSVSYTATPIEIELYRHLKDHFDKMKYYVDPCTPDPVCHDPGYFSKLREKIQTTLINTNEPFEISFHHPMQKSTDGKTSFFIVGIDELKSIRIRPTGLKECVELPIITEPPE